MAGKKGMKQYPLAMKLDAVRLHEEEVKSWRSPNGGRSMITSGWRSGSGNIGPKRRQPFGEVLGGRKSQPAKRENTAAYLARLEKENDRLKKSHAELRKLEYAKRNIGPSTAKKKDTK